MTLYPTSSSGSFSARSPWAFYEHAFRLLDWDDAIPYTYARLRGQAFSGHTIPANDRWIAACCVTHGLPLVTRNRKHFEPLRRFGLDLL